MIVYCSVTTQEKQSSNADEEVPILYNIEFLVLGFNIKKLHWKVWTVSQKLEIPIFPEAYKR